MTPKYFNEKEETHFQISMDTVFLQSQEESERQTSLVSRFTRQIIENPLEEIAICRYRLKETHYTMGYKERPMLWTFARGFTFYHVLYSLPDKEKRDRLMALGKNQKPIESLYESFLPLPKLPSVYLLMMQVYDIVGLESIKSCIHSEKLLPHEPKKIDDISNNEIDMKISKGKGKAIYFQKDFYLENLGVAEENTIFSYRAKPSYTNFSLDGKKEEKNVSFYQGNVLLDNKNEDIYEATMDEIVIPLKTENEWKQRRIRMKVLEEKCNERD